MFLRRFRPFIGLIPQLVFNLFYGITYRDFILPSHARSFGSRISFLEFINGILMLFKKFINGFIGPCRRIFNGRYFSVNIDVLISNADTGQSPRVTRCVI